MRYGMVSILALGVLTSCPTPPYHPPIGTNEILVEHVPQEDYYLCGPATIAMWRGWLTGNYNSVSQRDIWSWMTARYSSDQVSVAIGGAKGEPIRAAAQFYLGRYIYRDTYTGYDGVRHAVADQQMGLANGTPTIVTTMNDTHEVLYKAANWTRLNDAVQRPDFLWVKVQDPAHLPDESISLGDWMNYTITMRAGPDCPSSLCAENIQTPGQFYSGVAALDQFDAEGGTYYGPGPDQPTGRWKDDGWGGCYWEPNDSGPDQCSGSAPTGRYKDDGNGGCYWDPNDSGPDQCIPSKEVSLLARLRTGLGLSRLLSPKRIQADRAATVPLRTPASPNPHEVLSSQGRATDSMDKSPTRNGTKVPHPYATGTPEILENIAAAAQQTHLGEFAGELRLEMRNHELRARRVIDVKSLTSRPDYYAVELEDHSGVSVAMVAITKAGVILRALPTHGATVPTSIELAKARALLARYTRSQVRNMEYIYADNVAEPGNPIYAPLVRATTDEGVVYFNSRCEAFAEEGTKLAIERHDPTDVRILPHGAIQLRRLRADQ